MMKNLGSEPEPFNHHHTTSYISWLSVAMEGLGGRVLSLVTPSPFGSSFVIPSRRASPGRACNEGNPRDTTYGRG